MAAGGSASRSVVGVNPSTVLRQWLAVGHWELPILPETGAAVLEACRDEVSGARQVARIVERDPTLAAHVLRAANSAAYSPPEPIVSLTQAIGRMGLATVSEITVGVVVRGRVFTADRHLELVADVWPHSALAAGWARTISRQRRRNAEGAFLCGLLHDLGRPVVLRGLIDLERSTGQAFDDATIRNVMDELHPEIGGALVRRWSLPDWMGDAIDYHHMPELATAHRDEVMTTALASRLAHWSLERPAEDVAALRSLPLVGGLGLYPHDLDTLLAARGQVLEGAGLLA